MSDQAQAGRPSAGPDEEELRRAYEAELASISVGEIVLQSAVSLVNLGGMRLGLGGGPDGAGVRDLDQARDAIDAVRGLMPVLERHAGGHLRSIRDALAQLQFAYSREVAEAAEAAAPAAEQPPARATAPAAEQPPPRATAPAAQQAPGPAAAPSGDGSLGQPSSRPADGGDQDSGTEGGGEQDRGTEGGGKQDRGTEGGGKQDRGTEGGGEQGSGAAGGGQKPGPAEASGRLWVPGRR